MPKVNNFMVLILIDLWNLPKIKIEARFQYPKLCHYKLCVDTQEMHTHSKHEIRGIVWPYIILKSYLITLVLLLYLFKLWWLIS